MNRLELQSLAESRIRDAETLLTTGRWAAANYLAGYSAECGLKSCILRHLELTGKIFSDRKYLKELAECWTHQLDRLVELAGLASELGVSTGVNSTLLAYGGIVKDWKETSRYENRSEAEARSIFEALTAEPDGVMRWIRQHW